MSHALEPNNPPAAMFTSTRWTVVLNARDGSKEDCLNALQVLCQTYWYPLYAFIRRQGHNSIDAQDLTQAFFERLIQKDFLAQVHRDKGKFRSFLLGSLKHFLADEWDRSQRQKRGGGRTIVSFEGADPEERYKLEPVDRLDPERLYARRWAMTILDVAMKRLEIEFVPHKLQLWNLLQGFLVGDKEAGSYAHAGEQLGISEAAVKMAVLRMRQRCRSLIREEIAQTVSTAAEVEEEFRALLAALRS